MEDEPVALFNYSTIDARIAAIVRTAGTREHARRACQTAKATCVHCAGPHRRTTSTGQYLAVLVDYAWPYRQHELELQPHVVLEPHASARRPAGSYGSATRSYVKEQTGT